MLKSCIKNWKRIDDDMAADVAQHECSKIKCYASAFSNILMLLYMNWCECSYDLLSNVLVVCNAISTHTLSTSHTDLRIIYFFIFLIFWFGLENYFVQWFMLYAFATWDITSYVTDVCMQLFTR